MGGLWLVACASAEPDPKRAYFPPPTPVFGSAALNNYSRITINGVRRFEAPEELATHVGEFFYPALATRLTTKTLSKESAERLKRYTDARLASLNELKARLDALQNADAATRERELRAFAPTQAAQLTALERDAEQLRDELIRGRLLESSVDWNQNRGWHLGDKNLSATVYPRVEARIVRAAAFYQAGLTVEQRGLVDELGLQLLEETRAGMRSPMSSEPTLLFFSPATSRFQIPTGVTAELRELFGKFFHDREELKRDLRETINAEDAAGDRGRAKAFADLAMREAPQLLALERLADEIRQQLAALPPAAPPKLTHLPPDLVQLHTVTTDEWLALTTGLGERIRKATITSLQSPQPAGPDARRQQMRDMVAQHEEARRQAEADYRLENAARYAALEQNRADLQKGLAEFAATQIDPVTGEHPTVNNLLLELVVSNHAFDTRAREDVIYKDYKIAMLEPGLSAAQRRLLFNAALAGLSQELPPGEPMPGERFR